MILAKFQIITVAVILCAVVCVNAQKFGDKIKKPITSDNNNTNIKYNDNDNNNNNNNTSNAKNNSKALKEVAVSASQPKRKQAVVATNKAGKRPSDKKHANNKGYAEVKVYQYSMSHSDEKDDDMLPLNQQQINYGVVSNDPRDFERQFHLITSGFPKTAASDHNYQIPIYKAPNPPRAPNAPKIKFVEQHYDNRHDDNHQPKQHHQQPQQQHHRQHDNHNHQQQYRQQPQQQHHPNHQQNHRQHDNHQQNHHHNHQPHQQQQHHDSHQQQNHHQNHHQPQQQQQRHHQQHNNHDQNNLHHNQQHNHKNNRNNNPNTIRTNSGLSFDIPHGFPHPNDDKRAKFQKKLMGEQNREGKPWGAQMSYTYRDPKNPKNYVEVKEMHVNVNKENAMTPQESANQLQKMLQASQGNTYGLFASRPFDGQNPFGGRPGNVLNDFYADDDHVDHDEPRFPF